MSSSNSSMMPMLVLLACCCCSSSASGAGAYFLGYVPGNDKYYIRIFQLEKMFQIIEDIKNDMVYEGTAPNKYTGKISGTDLCDEIIKFYENLIEKRDDESEKVSDTDFKKLVKNYMDDNEIEGYTYDQAIDIIDFLYASCDEDKRVFKKTDALTTNLTKLFEDTPTTNTFTVQKAFCDDVKDGSGVVTEKGFKSLRKEITDVTDVSSLDQVWDESTGTLGVSGFSLTDLTSSVDYCETPFNKTCAEIGDAGTTLGADCDVAATCTWNAGSTGPPEVQASCSDTPCANLLSESVCPTTRCVWTANANDPSTGLCGDPCNTFSTTGSVPSATTDCPDTRCQWTPGTGSAAGTCGPKTT